MSKLTGWWKNRSTAAKVELYTRGSFHFFAVIEIFSFGLAPMAAAPKEGISQPVAVGALVVAVLHSLATAFLSSRALDWQVGARERPVRLAVATTIATALACLAVMLLRKTGHLPEAVAPSLVVGLACFSCGSLVLCMNRVRQMWRVSPAWALGAGTGVLALGLPAGEAAGYAVAVLVAGLFMSLACGFSGWLLRMVHELERARELQAQLAVAEERLRFGRDLHDVMGRNLAVIALKSELAVQLARRERPEAVTQMIEVQRIARESQREVRDVVRGYREADLGAELEGARGVLTAAGMDCRVEAEPGRTLRPEVQSALGWVVREATTNVLRHGDARTCVIRLTAPEETEEGELTLVVENDGAPEVPAGPPGSGLAGLRERLAVLDGTLEAGPVGDGRFRLRARIPGRQLRGLEVRA
ncbi:sensor histidine kinase [Streptomyces sp. NPDC059851]|uniref:sensor histidine kinase n=1 Tax=Streptomyces sp. NPDC059851 TaxID=3346971 RepID=UPI0036583DFA